MRLTKREITDKQALLDIFACGKVLHLAFQDEEGIAIYPVNYGYRERNGVLELVFHGAVAGRKATYFADGGHVSFEVETDGQLITGAYACAYSYAYRSVMGAGDVRLIKDSEEKKECLDVLLDHLSGKTESRTYTDEALLRTNVYVLSVTSMTGKQRA